jgi:hypothetical protein|tara:strand:+ start:379 stop:783 length:405 start_codon:yes stop_codon:yes gene_type:complete
MKIFNFTNGVRGEQVGDCKLENSSEGWLVRKNDKVFRVELANSPDGWGWSTGSAYLPWVDGEPAEQVSILPRDFGVEAICYCWGQTMHDKVWNWRVVGTTEWNRQACKDGILTATFTHNFDKECCGHPDYVDAN